MSNLAFWPVPWSGGAARSRAARNEPWQARQVVSLPVRHPSRRQLSHVPPVATGKLKSIYACTCVCVAVPTSLQAQASTHYTTEPARPPAWHPHHTSNQINTTWYKRDV